MPDADEKSIGQLVGAGFGMAGQKCMTLCVAIFVGEAKNRIPELVELSKKIKVNAGELTELIFVYVYRVIITKIF